ncbi:MAG: hypothetical protein HN849_04830 [Victivallales bacterium]|nr:hypothetical protein [Victivallales bacterium]MBT7298811.1 hypothetical protein [Victivallales bacterium]
MAGIILNQRLPVSAPQTTGDDAASCVTICLVGDFSHTGNGFALHELAADATIDDALEEIAPRAQVEEASFPVQEIEDLDPESLLRHSPLIQRLADVATRLRTPATATAALAELGYESSSGEAEAAAPTAESDPSKGSLLSRLLGETPEPLASEPEAPSSPTVDAFLQQLVKDHVVPDSPAVIQTAQEVVRGLRNEALDSLLHAPLFADLERTWRSADLLFDGIEGTDDCSVRFCLLDVTRSALADDLRTADGDSGQLLRSLAALRSDIPGGQPLGALVFLDSLDLAETPVLRSLCACTRALGTTTFIGLEPPLFAPTANPTYLEGTSELNERLAGLLAPLPEAGRPCGTGRLVTVPFRFLLRAPYGPTTDPVPGSDYQEVRCAEDVSHLPWACGAVPAALAYGMEWGRQERAPALPCAVDLDNLPFCTAPREQGTRMVPSGGFWLGGDAADVLLDQGLTALLSRRDQPTVRVLLVEQHSRV